MAQDPRAQWVRAQWAGLNGHGPNGPGPNRLRQAQLLTTLCFDSPLGWKPRFLPDLLLGISSGIVHFTLAQTLDLRDGSEEISCAAGDQGPSEDGSAKDVDDEAGEEGKRGEVGGDFKDAIGVWSTSVHSR